MISKENCIGCQACPEICPQNAITFGYDNWGEGRAEVEHSKCINCGLCEKVCPSLNVNVTPLNKSVMALISKKNASKGSSGGAFFELAKGFIDNGGIVYGAAFNDELKLVHQKATTIDELLPLCKSKYLHSDMTGIYSEIKQLLKSGKKIMFVGTPCQTCAVKNVFSEKYNNQILLVDFLCHGTGTQKVFDMCIRAEEKKMNGKITDFGFRSKVRKCSHSYTYNLQKNGKVLRKSGCYFEFPYYASLLKYVLFNDACYRCNYTQEKRAGDLTIGDFWKIHKYNPKLKDHKGVSLVSLNTAKGEEFFKQIKDKCRVYEYPSEYAVANNVALYKAEEYPPKRDELIEILNNKGEEALVKALACKNLKKVKMYYRTPKFIIRIFERIRGR